MMDKYFKWEILARILVFRPVSNVSAYHELDKTKKVFVGENNPFGKEYLQKTEIWQKNWYKTEKKVIKINSNNWIL